MFHKIIYGIGLFYFWIIVLVICGVLTSGVIALVTDYFEDRGFTKRRKP